MIPWETQWYPIRALCNSGNEVHRNNVFEELSENLNFPLNFHSTKKKFRFTIFKFEVRLKNLLPD